MLYSHERKKKERQLQNSILALMLWQEVKPRHVELSTWGCGTHACFGGHLSTWPEFQALGVRPESETCQRPVMRGCNEATTISDRLFGYPFMFAARMFHTEERGASDHKVVVNRLKTRIDFLSAELAGAQR